MSCFYVKRCGNGTVLKVQRMHSGKTLKDYNIVINKNLDRQRWESVNTANFLSIDGSNIILGELKA